MSRWTLEAAGAILPDVRRSTEEAFLRVEALSAEREAVAPDSPRAMQIEAEISRAVSRWIRAMEALGVDVKGAWLVDFDSGRGFYCWRWPEENLEYFHGYDEGFADRVRIQ